MLHMLQLNCAEHGSFLTKPFSDLYSGMGLASSRTLEVDYSILAYWQQLVARIKNRHKCEEGGACGQGERADSN